MIKNILFCLFLARLSNTYPSQNGNNYKEALKLSLLFYEAQRSGKLPVTNRIPWRGDSALDDRGVGGEDLSGGYYDASDFVKFGLTTAYAITMLSWGLVAYEEAYRKVGQYETAVDAIKWGTDYLVKCHVRPDAFYGQVGDFQSDHKYWGRPEEMNITRPALLISKDKPGSDVVGEASAALAASSMVFAKINHTYSKMLLERSQQLFDLADKHRGLFRDSYPETMHYHEGAQYGDELAWAAIWLYKSTHYSKYADLAQKLYKRYNLTKKPQSFFSSDKTAGVQLLLAQEYHSEEYLKDVSEFCDVAIRNETRTPKGLVYIKKAGTLAHAANIAFICLQASELYNNNQDYIDFAKSQALYILGSTGFNYVVGYGQNYPKKIHHAASSCRNLPATCDWADYKSPKANPQVLYGALVSGPNMDDYYEDAREEFLFSEVAIDYNAGFQGLLAGLLQHTLI